MSRSPAFQFYAADYLADETVQLMSLEEEGVYIRLIAYCWREGSVPADLRLLSRLCKGAKAAAIERAIESFVPHPEDVGRLVHPRLERERQKQKENRERRANAGKKGAGARWQSESELEANDETMPQNDDGIAIDLPMAKNSLSSSSSISSSTAVNNTGSHTPREAGCRGVSSIDAPVSHIRAETERDQGSAQSADPWPTLDEVKNFAGNSGILPECAEKWWLGMEACGWVNKHGQAIRKWRPLLISYGAAWRANDHQRQQAGKGAPSSAVPKPRPKQPPRPSMLFEPGQEPEGVKINQW